MEVLTLEGFSIPHRTSRMDTEGDGSSLEPCVIHELCTDLLTLLFLPYPFDSDVNPGYFSVPPTTRKSGYPRKETEYRRV